MHQYINEYTITLKLQAKSDLIAPCRISIYVRCESFGKKQALFLFLLSSYDTTFSSIFVRQGSNLAIPWLSYVRVKKTTPPDYARLIETHVNKQLLLSNRSTFNILLAEFDGAS